MKKGGFFQNLGKKVPKAVFFPKKIIAFNFFRQRVQEEDRSICLHMHFNSLAVYTIQK